MPESKLKNILTSGSNNNIINFFIHDIEKILPGFEVRPAQLYFLEQLNNFFLSDKKVAFIEGSTGTGKTIAYLYGALSRNKRIIISTKTKILQDQIINHDMLIISKIFKVKSGILKGRNSYVCLQKAYDLISNDENSSIKKWIDTTSTGLLEELEESPALKTLISSDSHTCLKSKCPVKDICFYQNVKKQLEDCNIVIVNHALLTKMAIYEPEFFNRFNILICDESFEIDRIFAQNSGLSISKEILISSVNYINHFIHTKETEELQTVISNLFNTNNIQVSDIKKAIDLIGIIQNSKKEVRKKMPLKSTYEKFKRTIEFISVNLELLLDYLNNKEYIVLQENQQISIIPRNLSYFIQHNFFSLFEKIIFISATLFVNNSVPLLNSFSIPRQLVFSANANHSYDYKKQIRFFVVTNVFNTNNGIYTPDPLKIAKLTKHITNKYPEGIILVLFTSWDTLRQTAIYYRSLNANSDNLLVHGELDNSKIIQLVKSGNHYIIFGNQSFWEGVDIPEDRISTLIITKLPFDFPDNWFLNMKCEQAKKHGSNPFYEVTLPQAVLLFKQGVGRLIRSQSKQGRLILCDDRVITKWYGRYFTEQLPEPKIVDFSRISSNGKNN
jgi:ATP-dependent DNA helicase DinG